MMEVQKNPELMRTAFRHLQTKEKYFYFATLHLLPCKRQLLKEQNS